MLTVTTTTGKGRTKKTHTLELYSDCQEFPIIRRIKLQNWLLHDSGIGNTMEAVYRRLATLSTYAVEGKQNEVLTETVNLGYTFFSMIQGIDYSTRSFACFVAKINGKEKTDISDSGLKATADEITNLGLISSEVQAWFEDVKKKLIQD